MFSKHINHKKIIACALGVILGLAPAPALVSAVTVHAQSDDEFEQSEVFQNWLGDVIADVGSSWATYLFTSNDPDLATLATVAKAVSMQNSWYLKLKNAVDANVEFNLTGAVYSGYYRIEENGQIFPSYILMPQSVSSGGTSVAYGTHFNIVISGEVTFPLNSGGSPTFESYIENDGIRYRSHTLEDQSFKFKWWDSNGYLTGQRSSTLLANTTKIIYTASTSSNIPVVSGSLGNANTLSGSGAIPNLPELGSPMSYAKPWEYYNDLVDYLNEDPSLPSGIVGQKYDPDNVQLPTSPHIGLNAEKGNLSDLNLDLEPYSSGFDFWWWLTDSVLTDLHLRTVVLLLIALGSVGFIVWKVGR